MKVSSQHNVPHTDFISYQLLAVTSSKPECKKSVVQCHNRKFNDVSPNSRQLEPRCPFFRQQHTQQFLNSIQYILKFFLRCVKTVCSRKMKLLDFYYLRMGHLRMQVLFTGD